MLNLPRPRNLARLMCHLTLLGCVLGIVLALLLAWNGYQQAMQRSKDELMASAGRLVAGIDHELQIRRNSLYNMKVLAEQYLAERSPLAWSAQPHLQPDSEHGGYRLQLPPGFDFQQLGNVTGLGPLPAADSQAMREIQMALSLTPIFRSLIERDPDTPWVYYTSAQRFLYLYPRVESSDFFVSQQTFSMPFYLGAHPAYNPSGELIWTPVYQDQAGKGWMVTMSVPVQERGRFRGAISVDIATSRLTWLLERNPVANTALHLLQANGRKLASSGGPTPALVPQNWPQYTLQERGQRLQAVFPLQSSNWFLVLDSDAGALHRAALRQSLPLALLAMFLTACLLLVLGLLRSQSRVEALSTHDWLTGVWNRRAFDEQLQAALSLLKREGSSLALILFDVDDFKHYNDTQGHPAGDKALQGIAAAVQQVAQRADDRVYRLGGEEFAVLASLPDAERLQAFMEHIGTAVREQRIEHPGSQLGLLTVSLGGVLLQHGSHATAADAYRQADKALYQAKGSGKNCACCWPGE